MVDSLVQKGVISADAGTEIFQQGNIRSQIELCLQEVSYHSTEMCDQYRNVITVQKCVISVDAGTEISQQGNIRSQIEGWALIELCLQEVSHERKVVPVQKYSSRETSGHR